MTAERFRAGFRHLLSAFQVLGWTDDHADSESFDQVWWAECDAMAALLACNNPVWFLR